MGCVLFVMTWHWQSSDSVLKCVEKFPGVRQSIVGETLLGSSVDRLRTRCCIGRVSLLVAMGMSMHRVTVRMLVLAWLVYARLILWCSSALRECAILFVIAW